MPHKDTAYLAPAPQSRRGWLTLAETCTVAEIVPAAEPLGEHKKFQAVLVTIGPKFYARRVMERTAAHYGMRLTDLRRTARVVNPATRELNWLYVATFERLDA